MFVYFFRKLEFESPANYPQNLIDGPWTTMLGEDCAFHLRDWNIKQINHELLEGSDYVKYACMYADEYPFKCQ